MLPPLDRRLYTLFHSGRDGRRGHRRRFGNCRRWRLRLCRRRLLLDRRQCGRRADGAVTDYRSYQRESYQRRHPPPASVGGFFRFEAAGTSGGRDGRPGTCRVQNSLVENEDLRLKRLAWVGLQQHEQRSGIREESPHQVFIALVPGGVRPRLRPVETENRQAALCMPRGKRAEPLDGFGEASQILVREKVVAAQAVLARDRLEIFDQDFVRGVPSEEDAADFRPGCVKDLPVDSVSHTAFELHYRLVGHGFFRNSKRINRSLSTGAPFWRAGSNRHCDKALAEASVSWLLPSENLTCATAPLRSIRASSSTLPSLAGTSPSGRAGSGCATGFAGTNPSVLRGPVNIRRRACRMPEDGAGLM